MLKKMEIVGQKRRKKHVITKEQIDEAKVKFFAQGGKVMKLKPEIVSDDYNPYNIIIKNVKA